MLASRTLFARRLLRWYDRHRRILPWRIETHAPGDGRPDPYYVLVSEAMLQQTQVATVVPYFSRFMDRFPTLADLAGADEQQVLRLWQGLGYYSRARNLHKTARKIMADFGGRLPCEVFELIQLPGIGRYTAGAVSSIAFGRPAPIVDGNVARVLCRIDLIRSDPREGMTQKLLWRRAEEILPKKRVGDFNSALMELGAMICTPRSPKCLACPVREHCKAFAAGLQEKIPAPRAGKVTPLLKRAVFCIRRGEQWLIERRPSVGRWAGLWQFITVEFDEACTPAEMPRSRLPIQTHAPVPLGMVKHALTHRRYHFEVFVCDIAGDLALDQSRKWTTLAGLDHFPLSRPHLKIAAMLEKF